MPPSPPTPDHALLARLVRRAHGRGLPIQEAEDAVVRVWERCTPRFDPSRGTLEALLFTAIDREVLSWWRARSARERQQDALVHHETERRARPYDTVAAARARKNQQRVLDALEPDERAIFGAWALQKSLPGRFTAAQAAQRTGLTVPEYEAAKKRLQRRIRALLTAWGRNSRDLQPLSDDEAPRRKVNRG